MVHFPSENTHRSGQQTAVVDRHDLRTMAFDLSPVDQYLLACHIAENVGYSLTPSRDLEEPAEAGLRVVAAAHLYSLPVHEDPRAVPVVVSAPPPARHHNLFALAWPMPPDESGFLLSDGTFATRERAAVVAIETGQTTPEAMTVPGKLFSEDLW